jgi:hypothetical protein
MKELMVENMSHSIVRFDASKKPVIRLIDLFIKASFKYESQISADIMDIKKGQSLHFRRYVFGFPGIGNEFKS